MWLSLFSSTTLLLFQLHGWKAWTPNPATHNRLWFGVGSVAVMIGFFSFVSSQSNECDPSDVLHSVPGL